MATRSRDAVNTAAVTAFTSSPLGSVAGDGHIARSAMDQFYPVFPTSGERCRGQIRFRANVIIRARNPMHCSPHKVCPAQIPGRIDA
jgi:hypothetical protein